MADLCGAQAVMLMKSDNGTHDTVFSDEHEHDNVPFKLRMKKSFFGSNHCPESSDISSSILGSGSEIESMSLIDVKKEDQACYSQLLQGILSLPAGCFPDKEKDETVGQKQNHDIDIIQGVTAEASAKSAAADLCLRDTTFIGHDFLPGDCNCQEILSNACDCPNQTMSTAINTDIFGVEKVNGNVCSLTQYPTPSKMSGKVKVEFLDDNQMSLVGVGTSCSAGFDLQAEIPDELMNDDLDHIVLKERQRMLLSRNLLGKAESVPEGSFKNSAGREKEESLSVDGEFSAAGSSCRIHPCSSSPSDFLGEGMNISDNRMEIKENSSAKNSSDLKSSGGQLVVHVNPDGMLSSTLPSFLKVKVETSDNNDFHRINSVREFSFNNVQTVKSELEIPDRFDRDELDHMPLQDRMKLLASGEVSNSFISEKDNMPSPLESSPVVLESIKPVTIKRLRKRKKTATDSIETALEEDAPGLLQVLIDKGISVDEIRLYGESESDDALDDSFSDDSFAELEAVISKLFSQRQSLLKLAPIRCTKGSKTSYCLACLISLVEQTRYLRFRKWPVEWGWCRDLQSFIFVFERHNRIVLERPEYGYATYFFELIDSLPIDWQIKRLVTAMKLTSCSRINLIENKALLVGDDLTEGEAQVLAGYGWIPDTGLGTMLNYRDRVFHDSNNVKDSSEWRSKIGKLLMDGYNGGTMVLTDIPKKFMEYRGTLTPHIKLEL